MDANNDGVVDKREWIEGYSQYLEMKKRTNMWTPRPTA